MFDLGVGEVVIEDDGVLFDVHWKDACGLERTTNVFLVRDEATGGILVSKIDENNTLISSVPKINSIELMVDTDPILLSAILTKLKNLPHPVAEEALRLCGEVKLRR